MKMAGACAVFLIVAGCGSTSSDPDLDAWEREVRVLTPQQVGERQYEELGGLLEEKQQVRSTYGGEDTAIDEAKRALRRRAAALDADAVVIVRCGSRVRSMEEDRLPSMGPEVVCHGVAIRWLD